MTQMKIALGAFAALALGGAVYAASHSDTSAEVKARQGLMSMVALHTGVVGGMARGTVEYDAEAAQAAADTLAGLSMASNDFIWPEGSSTDDIENTRALPKIWEDRAGYQAKWDAFSEAAVGLQKVAGTGLDPLKAAVGALGQSCGSCHDDYRQPR